MHAAVKLDYDGPFFLPHDTQRLMLAACAAGCRAAFVDYPNVTDACVQGRDIAAITLRSRPDITNEPGSYQDIFIYAYTLGYQLCLQHLIPVISQRDEQSRASVLASMRNLSIAQTATLIQAYMTPNEEEVIPPGPQATRQW